MTGGHRSHGRGHGTRRDYPRVARINEVLREVIAEELEKIGDDALDLVTVTGVSADPDLRHATVWFSALTGETGIAGATVALAEHRVELQAAVGRQVRLKRTPLLQFKADPAITTGQRIEDVIRTMPRAAVSADGDDADDAADGPGRTI